LNVYSLKVDGIFVQSDFHRDYIINQLYRDYKLKEPVESGHVYVDSIISERIVIAPNGVCEKTISNGRNSQFSFIYASAPNRGLENILEHWTMIRSAIPQATLHIYYGFRYVGDRIIRYPFHSYVYRVAVTEIAS
jgi:hypothetical protein